MFVYHHFILKISLFFGFQATYYQFSLSWSRILPDATLSRVNKSALDYYDALINTLIENGIEPIVTLYSGWDMPDALYERYPKGWMDESMVKEFGKYAQLCFKKFGDRVRRWISIHDPWTHCEHSCGNNSTVQQASPVKIYSNLMKAHSLVYRIYGKGFRRIQRGKVGISINAKCVTSASLNQINDTVPHDLISEVSFSTQLKLS
jgi:beta-glucosidase/6-phospho-beta-glucosidase/beta-galactosidase